MACAAAVALPLILMQGGLQLLEPTRSWMGKPIPSPTTRA